LYPDGSIFKRDGILGSWEKLRGTGIEIASKAGFTVHLYPGGDSFEANTIWRTFEKDTDRFWF